MNFNNNKVVVRDSNMELLRIIAMLLVMIVHANFRALPVPTTEECNTEVTSSILRFFTESFSIIAVNLFVLLSGWYGIKFKIQRLIDFLFQVFFFSILCYFIFLLLNPIGSYFKSFIVNTLLLKPTNYWFVKAYLGLYIFAPILNAFVETATKRQFQVFLVSFFMFQTLYGWITPSAASFFVNGYSTISFIGLYLLARYIHLYPHRVWKLGKKIDLLFYALIVLFTTFITYILQRYNLPGTDRFFLYTSPLVIIAAVHFLLFFSKIKVANKTINWVARSCFGIYLLHSNSFLATPYYDNVILNLFQTPNRNEFILYTSLFILGVFVIAILFDKIRILIYNYIQRIILYLEQIIKI